MEDMHSFWQLDRDVPDEEESLADQEMSVDLSGLELAAKMACAKMDELRSELKAKKQECEDCYRAMTAAQNEVISLKELCSDAYEWIMDEGYRPNAKNSILLR